jgi:hypothetical protein
MSAIDEIEKLALNTAKEALTKDTKLQEKIDALKALSPYYSVLAKARANEPEDTSGSLEHLAQRIRDTEEPHSYDSRDVQDRTRRRGN